MKVKIQIQILEQHRSMSSDPTILRHSMKQQKNESEKLNNSITEGIIFRSKCNWYENGEKSSWYFLNLQCRNKAKSSVRCLKPDNKSNK